MAPRVGTRFGGGQSGSRTKGPPTRCIFFGPELVPARARMLDAMRRLLAVVSVIVFTDTMLFSAIVPLDPRHSPTRTTSRSFSAGLLVGAYGAGAVVGGIPAGLLASRIGPKRTVIIGLLVLGALDARVLRSAPRPSSSGLPASRRGSRAPSRGRAPSPGSRSATPRELAREDARHRLQRRRARLHRRPGDRCDRRARLDPRRHSSSSLRSRSPLPRSPHRSRPDLRMFDILGRFAEPCRTPASSRPCGSPSSLPSHSASSTCSFRSRSTTRTGARSRSPRRSSSLPWSRSPSLPPIGGFSDRRGRLAPIRAGLVLLVVAAVGLAAADLALSHRSAGHGSLDRSERDLHAEHRAHLGSRRGRPDSPGARLRLHEHRLGRRSDDRPGPRWSRCRRTRRPCAVHPQRPARSRDALLRQPARLHAPVRRAPSSGLTAHVATAPASSGAASGAAEQPVKPRACSHVLPDELPFRANHWRGRGTRLRRLDDLPCPTPPQALEVTPERGAHLVLVALLLHAILVPRLAAISCRLPRSLSRP